MLRDRACVGGGWNYGNRIVLDEELPPFVQTTGIALLALHGLDEPMVETAAERLAAIWPQEADGLLSLALAAAALRTIGHRSAAEVARRLRERQAAVADADTIALAWSVDRARGRARTAGGGVMHHHDEQGAVDRRTFLRGAVVAGVAVGAVGVGLGVRRALEPEPWDEAAFPPPGDAHVAVLAASSYDADLAGPHRGGAPRRSAPTSAARRCC